MSQLDFFTSFFHHYTLNISGYLVAEDRYFTHFKMLSVISNLVQSKQNSSPLAQFIRFIWAGVRDVY